MKSLAAQDLVFEKRGDIFTTSEIIAREVGVKNRSVYLLIEKYEKDLKEFGRLSFEMTPSSTASGVQDVKSYRLNEQQATLLMTYLRNNDVVRQFKIRLVKEFFAMREFIRHKHSEEYQRTRIASVENQKAQMDLIGKAQPKESYMKANTIACKAVQKALGLATKPKKADLTAEQLIYHAIFLQKAAALITAKKMGAEIESVSKLVYAQIPEVKMQFNI